MNYFNNLCEVLKRNANTSLKGITFISSSNDEKRISYKELYNNALKVLYMLQERGIGVNDELVFQIEDNEAYLTIYWACLLGGIIPVPTSVGHNDEHKAKLYKIWNVLNNPYLITDKETLFKMDKYTKNTEYSENYKIVAARTLLVEDIPNYSEAGKEVERDSKDIAFIQFSSGSTGDPKGVILTHGNLLCNVLSIIDSSKMTSEDRTLSWMPLTHDMGMIGLHLTPMTADMQQYWIPTSLFIRNPVLWIKKADEHRISILCSPNFGYRYFLTFYKPENAVDWDLSCVRVIFNGAEPISSDLCHEFLDVMEKHKLRRNSMYPVYGMAEACLGVTFPVLYEDFRTVYIDRDSLNVGDTVKEVNKGDVNSVSFVDVGYAINNCEVRICNDKNKMLEDGIIGNIQIRGDNVTQGYYNNPAATGKAINGDGWLNTGDLGYMKNNRLVITGRAKDIIFVNGQNIYPHDIERVAEGVDGIELGKIAACGVQNTQKQLEELIIFVVFKKTLEEFAKLALEIRKCINVNMGLGIDYIIPVKKIPKTTSGKVQRYKLGEMFKKGEFDETWKTLKELMEQHITQSAESDNEDISEIQDKLLNICRQVLNNDKISIKDNFFEWGINSLQLSTITHKLDEAYPGKVTVTDLFAYPTISKLSAFIENGSDNTFAAVQEADKCEDIAIIGMALKFPMADDVDEFWKNIRKGKESVSSFPKSRQKDVENYFNYIGRDTTDIDYVEGCYLKEIDKFDYKLFRVTPKEASLMNPNQRIFLETAWQALEDAGYSSSKLSESKTGVYLGYIGDIEGFKYKQMICDVDSSLSSMSMAGNLPSIIPSRISYLMDLKGPTMLIDTACSSSLVAVHLASQGLLKGDCDMALAGGVRVSIIPVKEQRIGMESSDGKARTFDDSSDGTGLGEGVAVVVLKQLSKALRDGDNIYSVIKGSAINQDGSSAGITAPNLLAQADVISAAWRNSGVNPETISYIEAHGTGTKLGDPIEIAGIKQAFRRFTDKKQFCAIGSVKTNIGHLFETAGIASLIKSALALKHKELPPSINFKKPNSEIDFEDSPVYVIDKLTKWESDGNPRRCGISAFGFSGTNCHVIMEEAPEVISTIAESTKAPRIMTLSARSEKSLKKLINRYSNFALESFNLDDVCFTANTGRGQYNYRIAAVVNNAEEFKALLDELNKQELDNIRLSDVYYGNHKVVVKEPQNEDELSEADKAALAKEVNKKLKKYIKTGQTDKALLEEICLMYVKGADVEWDMLYDGKTVKRVSLPLCPMERERCWLDIPGTEGNDDSNICYALGFRIEELSRKAECCGNGSIAVFKDNCGKADKLINKLNKDNRTVIEISLGEGYEKLNDNSYIIGGNEADYTKLFEELKEISITDIIHMATLSSLEIQNVEQLEQSQKNGVYSLFYLTRALYSNGIKDKIRLFIVSDYVNSVSGAEEQLKPHNAPMLALGKAIEREYPSLGIFCLDIDEHTTLAEIYDSFMYQSEYRASYRSGSRYVEEFRGIDIEDEKEEKAEIKENGVYLITGGMGGIGFEIAKYLTDKNTVKLGLVNRTSMPEREQWEEILSKGQDKKAIEKIKAVQQIEAKGSVVECLSADASNYEQMRAAVNALREKHGKIDGVIHGAGVAGDGYIARKEEKIFTGVIRPKIIGTWILNEVTKEDNLDFFVMFSSVATVLTVHGQGDYAAANSYMDAFAEYRTKLGKKTLSINWVPWKEIGMAVNHGANTDTVFKAIYTDKAIEAFDAVLNRKLNRVLIGQLNFESKMVYMLERFPFKLSSRVKHDLDLCKKKLETEEKSTETEKKIIQACVDVLGIKDIDVNISFFDLGADSIALTRLSEKLEKMFPGKVSVSKIFGHPTISKLAEYIDKQGGEKLQAIEKQERKNAGSSDIAIIGMALKMPGANNADELWEIVKNAKDQITPIPKGRRRDVDNYLVYTGMEKDQIKYIDGGYLDEIDKFDYKFFRITPMEANLMDPNQRLFLQTVWAAIEDAGYGGKKIIGSNTGMYVGYGMNPRDNYARMMGDTQAEASSVSIPGNLPAIIPSRVSYILDLKGPSILLDTACSSSLLSVHLACKALKEGECDMAIAGGIKLNLLPIETDMELGIESSDSRARTFDDSSDGTGAGEGVGAVMLKPLDKAIADGDNIYAVIKGSAVNQDGSSAGITAPNASAQTEVILNAWKDAGVNPETIAYIEAHGTGTKLGDPIEIEGLTEAFRRYTDKNQFCGIGSIKTNIGHLYEAAGVTGLIKATLQLKHKQFAPSLHFKKPNHRISFEDCPVYVNTELRSWEEGDAPRRCGISAFGLSGTNCHMILEEAPPKQAVSAEAGSGLNVFTISAKSEQALREFVLSYKKHCTEEASLTRACYTVNTGRGHYNYRLALIADSMEQLVQKLEGILDTNIEGNESNEIFYGDSKTTGNSMEQTQELNNAADIKLKEYLASGKSNIELLRELCQLYVKGAEVFWDELYQGEKITKVSLPTYPFDKHRCWLELPEAESFDEDMNTGSYHRISFVEDAVNKHNPALENGNVLVFRNDNPKAEKLVELLRQDNHTVIEVFKGSEFAKLEANRYMVGNAEEDYNKLINDLKDIGFNNIIHMMTLGKGAAYSLEQLRDAKEQGIYSLFHLIRALSRSSININNKLDIALVAENVHLANGKESAIVPENAALFGLGKGIEKEHSNIKVRCIDIDEAAAAEQLYEAIAWQMEHKACYRSGIKYVEEFAKVDMQSVKDDKIEIKDGGVYVITGGLGDIGLEISKKLAEQNKVKLALINRSNMPERSEWEAVLNDGKDLRAINRIKAIKQIEANGSEVICVSANVSDLADMRNAIDSIRQSLGKLNGVIHVAGLPGSGNIAQKDNSSFESIINPKLEGTWILDNITKADNLDFFLVFSSVATVFSAQGQADYVAANSYLDSFAESRRLQGKKTLAINWVIWKEIGMAVAKGMGIDTIFKAIPTAEALTYMLEALNKDINRVIVGQLNIESPMVFMIENSQMKLSDDIKQLLARLRNKKKSASKQKTSAKAADVKLRGRDGAEYSEIEQKLAEVCREVLGIKEIDVEESFFDLGADSILLSQMNKRLEELYPNKITVAKIFAYPSISKLAEYLSQFDREKLKVSDNTDGKSSTSKDIAIIGMGLKFPMADNPRSFWDNIREGRDCIEEIASSRRRDIDNYLAFSGMDIKNVRYMEGGYLKEIDKFDNKFFRITPKEASLMDPNQRLFLETVWAAIEDAGYGGQKITGSNTGLYVGFSNNFKDNYGRMVSEIEPESLAVSIPGNLAAIIPSRVSYILDLKGPSLVVDTACSSALVALYLASKALREGDCDMAIAGGVKINLIPIDSEVKLGIESSDYRTRAFDDSSDGTGIGDGIGAVLLKPLDKAVEDGDNIYAVIKGGAINQDGTSAGITAPNAAAQTDVILSAWKDAGIDPETISFIEAHGTGTTLGDPIEVEGLTEAFRRYTDKNQFCAIGSVKTNIGHLFEAAGIASVIKTALSLKHKEIVPSVHFNKANHRINFEESPVYVNTELKTWNTKDIPRRCGISSFGFSGTNCHMVLEEAPLLEEATQIARAAEPVSSNILTLSAKSEEALRILIGNYKEALNEEVSISDLCFTANTGRGHYEYRLAVIAEDKEQLRASLEGLSSVQLSEVSLDNVLFGKHKIVFDGIEAKDGELTKEHVRSMNKQADEKLKSFIDLGKADARQLRELAELYVKGAEIFWDELYSGEKHRRVSLPTYPFERIRYWLDVPGADSNETNLYYKSGFRKEDISKKEQQCGNGTVAVLSDTSAKADELISKLTNEGRAVIRVNYGTGFEAVEHQCYTVGDCEQDYIKLFAELKDKNVTDIVHMAALKEEEATTLEGLRQSQRYGVFSLYYLTRALAANEIKSNIRLLVVSDYVNSVTGEEELIKPENAPVFALGRAVTKEYNSLNICCMDIDAHTTIDEIYDSFVWQQEYRTSYRKNSRYIEEFTAVDIDNAKEEKVKIKEDGVYIITGGMGGIGFEVAKHLARHNKVKLGLVNRSRMPERAQWEEILSKGQDKKTIDKIKAVQEIEAKGSTVECLSADVSSLTDMKTAVDLMREKYGKIDGVIHGAGVAGDGYIIRKDEKLFSSVIEPKVYGTWILDNITKEDNLDFFIMFSSVATLLTVNGQGDYAAANSYMDSFTEYRTAQGKKTLTINWVSWKETGMAVNHGVNNDTIFKVIATDMALKAFDEALNKKVNRILIGQLNFDSKMVYMLEKFPFRLSSKVKRDLEICKKKLETEEKSTETQKKIIEVSREVLGINDIDVDTSFFDMGADSIMLSMLNEKLEKIFPGRVTVSKLFGHPTIAKLAEYIDQQDNKKSKDKTEQISSGGDVTDIAIIGMAYKLPGADNEEALWDIFRNGRDLIKPFPIRRKKDIDKYLTFNGMEKSKLKYMEGGYLENIDGFDYKFFRMTPKEASIMDPHQRLFLETAWAAIEDAGYGGKRLAGSNTGIYIGYGNNFKDSYGKMVSEIEPDSLAMAIPGNIPAIIPSRVSYVLDLKGPSILIDTACSSSLVTVHMACKAIKQGECDMAIAGGIKLNLVPVDGDVKLGIESSDYRTRAFDDNSDGTGIGEGVTAVILKPLDKAKEDGDNIYAVIKGSAVNQDGNSAGITAPNASAQTEVVLNAWKDAGVDPETISYIEAHGTGTKLGDPIEIEGLTEAFREYTDKKQFCAIGSVKTNIGHLFEAAGMAGLLKSVLLLKNKELVPSIHFSKPNHRISFEDSPVYVNTELRKWDSGDAPRRCGISAFGFSGTNCHVILEEAPWEEKVTENNEVNEQLLPQILTLSAKSEESLKNLAKSYRQLLKNSVNISNVCYTTNVGRGHYEFRLAFVINSKVELENGIGGLSSINLSEITNDNVFYGSHKVVFDGREVKGGEVTKEYIKELTKQADSKLKQFIANGKSDLQLLKEVAELYVQGADISWDELYSGEKLQKVSLPTYPFEKMRCWLDIKSADVDEDTNVHYVLGFKESALQMGSSVIGSGNVVVFKDSAFRADNLIQKLKQEGHRVIAVSCGTGFERVDSDNYTIGNNQEDYTRLFSELKACSVTDIIHMAALTDTGIQTLEQLDNTQKHGVYSLYYLVKAMYANDIKTTIGLMLISDYVNSVDGEEKQVKPENAPMFALAKAIQREYPSIHIRCMDIDDAATAEELYDGIRYQQEYRAAYRSGKRYIEEFKSIDLEGEEEQKVDIKEDGVYVITGGMGGIGFEIAKYLARRSIIKLGLINRSRMPERSEWQDILSKGQDKRTIDRIKAIQEIEAHGSTVECLSADVTNLEQMKNAISSLRAKHGKIDGVIHGAGVAGDGYIVRKDEEIFNGVIKPKVNGTWILDNVTREDKLDFFIMFSSVATVFPIPGQGDYAAANSYMDSFAEYRSKLGKKTLTINWVSWKEVGMAFDHGFNQDMAFKAIYTETAINAFNEVLSKNINRVLIGELNYDNDMLYMLDMLPFKLSPGIMKQLEKFGKNAKAEKSDSLQMIEKLLTSSSLPEELASKLQSVYGELKLILKECESHIEQEKKDSAEDSFGDITLKGRESNNYSKNEMLIAKYWSDVLGIKEFGVDDNYFEVGGDSIKAIQISSRLQKSNIQVDINDLLKYPTIASLAEYLDSIAKNDDADGDLILTPVQQWLLEQNNISIPSVILQKADGFEEEIVEKVLQGLIQHHDSLRIVFEQNNEQTVQRIEQTNKKMFDFKVIDLSTDDNYEAQIRKNAADILESMGSLNKMLVKAVLFRTKETDYLLLAVHPLISDKDSLDILLEDFSHGYLQLKNNENLSFESSGSSFRAWCSKLKDLAHSKQTIKEVEYWTKLEENDTQLLESDNHIQDNDIFSANIIAIELSEEDTRKLLENANEVYNTQTDDILLTALGMTIEECFNKDKLLISIWRNRRSNAISELDIDRTIGQFDYIHPLLLDMANSEDMSYRIKAMKENIRHIPNNGLGYGLLRYICKDGTIQGLNTELAMSYLGESSENSSKLFDVCYKHMIQNKSSHNLNIVIIIRNNKLTVEIEYNKSKYNDNVAIKLAECFKNSLLQIIEHCISSGKVEYTPSDFGSDELSITEVEDILDLFQ